MHSTAIKYPRQSALQLAVLGVPDVIRYSIGTYPYSAPLALSLHVHATAGGVQVRSNIILCLGMISRFRRDAMNVQRVNFTDT